MKQLVMKNAPEELIPLAKKWQNEGKSFYLGPETIFQYNNEHVIYKGGENISKEYGSWSINTDDMPYPIKWENSEEEINEIAEALSINASIEFAFLYTSVKCNAKCIMCPYHKESSQYKELFPDEQNISAEKLKFRLEKIKQTNIEKCGILSNGEILAIPYWKDLFSYANELGLKQYFISNGIAMNNNTKEFLKEHNNFFFMQFSLNAFSFETWKKIFNVNNEEAYKNAINAPLFAKEIGVPLVGVSFVLQKENQHELNQFIEYWKDKVDRIRIIECNSEQNLIHNYNNSPVKLCQSFYSKTIYIAPSGLIAPCCVLENTNLKKYFINFDTTPVEEIKQKFIKCYNNEHIIEYCKTCSRYNRFGRAFDVTFKDGISGRKTGSTIAITNDK